MFSIDARALRRSRECALLLASSLKASRSKLRSSASFLAASSNLVISLIRTSLSGGRAQLGLSRASLEIEISLGLKDPFDRCRTFAGLSPASLDVIRQISNERPQKG